MMRSLLGTLLLCALSVATVAAGTGESRALFVPDDYPTIQAAIDAAGPGDTVFVRAGRYEETIIISKPLQLLGEDPLSTVVSGPRVGCDKWEGSVVEVDLGEGEVLLRDLTLANGKVALRVTLGEGAAVVVEHARLGTSVFGVLARGEGALTVQSSLVFTCAIGICTGLAETRLVEVTMGSGEPFALGRDFMTAVGLTGVGRVTIERCLIGPLRPWGDSSYAFDSGQFSTDGSFFHFGDTGWFLGLGDEAPWFRGTVVGSGNRVFVVEEEGGRRSAERKVISPDLWPRIQSDQFIDEDWGHTVREAHAGCLRGVSALKAAEDLGSWAGDVHEVRDRYAAAEHEFRAALGLLVSEARFPFFEAVLRWLLSDALYGQRRFEEAFAQLEAARPVIVMHLDLIRRMLFDLDIAINCTATGRWAEAAVVLERVFADLPVFPLECRSIWYYDLDWQVAARLGQAYEVLDRPLEAIAAFKTAVAYAEWVRSERWTEETNRRWWMARTRYPYERLVDLLSRQGMGQSGFPYAERSRARTFLDILYGGGVEPEQLISPEAGISAGVVSPEAIDAAVGEALAYLEPNEAVLSYFTTERGVYLWVIAWDEKEGAHVVSEPIFREYPRADLLRDVVETRTLLETPSPTTAQKLRLEELLEGFYSALVLPGMERLPGGVDTLVLVPSGPLWYVPFAGLLMTDIPRVPADGGMTRPPHVVEHYTVAYLPSVASLTTLVERTELGEGMFMGLADPELTSDQEDQLRSQGGVGSIYFDKLREAVRSFASCHGGEPATVHVGAEATEARAHLEAPGHRVVVYAAHGQFNPHVPLQSGLYLAPSEGPRTEGDPRVADGAYRAWEILLTDHRGTELVVLAACESFLPALRNLQGQLGVLSGKSSDEIELTPEQLEWIVVGDEVVGMARAFLSSGAHSVLGTLWQANPDAITLLLGSICGHQQTGLTWAQALRQAQIELVGHPTYGHPWFWAPFQLVGRWR